MTDRTGRSGRVTTRRRLLRALVAAGSLAGVAGCLSSTGRGPDPDVVWEELDPELDAVTVTRTVVVTAMVANLGDPGEVVVIAETRVPGGEEPLDTHSLTLEMERNEQREIDFEMEVSPTAGRFDARAEPANREPGAEF